MDAAHTALTFTFETAAVGSWARDVPADDTIVDVHLRVLGEDFLRGIQIGLPGSDHPQPWSSSSRAHLGWGAAIVTWLDDLILQGCTARVFIENILDVLYFEVTPSGLRPR
jgi:hypothetical protein